MQENDKIKVFCFEEECFLCPDQMKCSVSGMTLKERGIEEDTNYICSFDRFFHCLSRCMALHDDKFVITDEYKTKIRAVYDKSVDVMKEFNSSSLCIICHTDFNNKTAQE